MKLARSLPRSWRNAQRLRALNETHDDWSIMNCGAHDFGIVVVYTTLAEQKRQLAAAGFDVELVLDNVAGYLGRALHDQEAVRQALGTRDMRVYELLWKMDRSSLAAGG